MLTTPTGLKLDRPISERGAHIPIRRSFTGIKNLNFLTVGRSYFTSDFVLFEDYIETTVMLTSRSLISELESVELINNLSSNRLLVINWKNSPFTFQTIIEDDDILHEVLLFFAEKNVPLNAAAQALLKNM